MINQIKWCLIPVIDFMSYTYKFLSRLLMIIFFINLWEHNAYLWWDMYHWTQDHWYTMAFVVVILSYITFKNAKNK